MRVVILYNTCWYVFLLRRNLIASLLEAGHSVTVIAPPDAYTERVLRLGVRYIPISLRATGRSPLQETISFLQIYEALRSIQPDAVLSYTIKCNLYAGLCRSRLSFRHIANISGLGQVFDANTITTSFVRRLYRRSLTHTHKVFFQNREDHDLLLREQIVSSEQAQIIPGSGVDLERFHPTTRTRRSTRSFLMLGRLLPKKGFMVFIEAAMILRKRYGERVAFWILGAPDYERPESLELLEHIIASHASGTIRYLQSTDDVLPYICESDVVVLPSTYNEGIPRSLLEALACGKPIVTTNWKGCRETVEHGHNGLLVLPDSTESLVRSIAQLIECPDEDLETMGYHSRRLAVERFNEQTVIQAYHQALEGTKASGPQYQDPDGPFTSLPSEAQRSMGPMLSSLEVDTQIVPLVRVQDSA